MHHAHSHHGESHQRPLSPHLQVYRPQLTSVMSILHRMTGVVLSAGLLYVTLWLYCVAMGDASYERFQAFAGHWSVKAFLFVWTASLFYHFFNGIRHLFWDIGWGYELPCVYKSGYLVLGLTVVSSLLFWGVLRWI